MALYLLSAFSLNTDHFFLDSQIVRVVSVIVCGALDFRQDAPPQGLTHAFACSFGLNIGVAAKALKRTAAIAGRTATFTRIYRGRRNGRRRRGERIAAQAGQGAAAVARHAAAARVDGNRLGRCRLAGIAAAADLLCRGVTAPLGLDLGFLGTATLDLDFCREVSAARALTGATAVAGDAAATPLFGRLG